MMVRTLPHGGMGLREYGADAATSDNPYESGLDPTSHGGAVDAYLAGGGVDHSQHDSTTGSGSDKRGYVTQGRRGVYPDREGEVGCSRLDTFIPVAAFMVLSPTGCGRPGSANRASH